MARQETLQRSGRKGDWATGGSTKANVGRGPECTAGDVLGVRDTAEESQAKLLSSFA